jgi:hypothetical protein
MVRSVSSNEATLVGAITNQIAAQHFSNTGDHHNWAEAWATDTIKQAKKAFAGVSTAHALGQRETANPDIIDITLTTSTYRTKLADVIRRQFAKAASDLTDLLNQID